VKAKQMAEIPELDPDRIPVVLIEDNRETAFVVSKFLEHSEFQVIAAYDVEKGMELVETIHPSAVVLDVLVDDETSWETLKKIRAKNVPVVSVSILSGEGEKATSLGASTFLAKPLSREALVKALRAATYRGTVRKLLLIDDHELVRYSLRELLGKSKLELLEARSGREGVRLAESEHPDVIFLDLVMPDMSGFEVLNELRSTDSTRSIPVIIHSSQELTEEGRSSLRLQSVALLRKTDTSGPEALAKISQVLATVGFGLEAPEQHHV